MQAIGTCLKENMMPMALGEMEQLSMFITTDMCDKMNAYLKGRSFGKLSFLKCQMTMRLPVARIDFPLAQYEGIGQVFTHHDQYVTITSGCVHDQCTG